MLQAMYIDYRISTSVYLYSVYKCILYTELNEFLKF